MLTITVEKDEIGPYLQVLAERSSDWTQPITKVLEAGMQDARDTITSGGPDFGWAPHSPWTYRVDSAIGRTRKGMLNETGALLSSLGGGAFFQAGPTEGEAGTSLPYAHLQQEGTTRTFFLLKFLKTGQREFGGRGIPPRPFLYWHEEKFPEYDAIFMNHLMDEAGEGNA